MFGVESTTVTEWARTGKVVATQIGKRWYFPKNQFKVNKVICVKCEGDIGIFTDEAKLMKAFETGLCQKCQEINI